MTMAMMTKRHCCVSMVAVAAVAAGGWNVVGCVAGDVDAVDVPDNGVRKAR